MTVMALLLMAALPSMSGWLRNTRVRNAAESVQMGLQRARMEAVRRNQNVTFWLVSGSDERNVDNSCALSSAAGSWVISLSNPANKCATAPSMTDDPMIVETHAAGDGGSGVTVAATAVDASAANCVRFNGFGQVVGSRDPAGRQLPVADADRDGRSHSCQRRCAPSARRRVRRAAAFACATATSPSSDPRACPP